MRNTLLAAAVASALAMAATDASAASGGTVTKAQMDAMQAQMQALSDRLTKLETANSQLSTENQQLKSTVEQRDAEMDYLKAQTKDLREQSAQAAADADKVKGADWASRIKFFGDFRAREEFIGNQYVAGAAPTAPSTANPNGTPSTLSVEDASDNWRTRYRMRVGATAQVTEHSKVTFRLDSGDGDPRSSNQTYTNESSEKGIFIGQAYADWNFVNGGDLLLGKQPLMFWRPAYSLFWDGDVNPEAFAVTYNRGMFFGSGWAWLIQNNQNNNSSYVNVDPTIFGAQAGLTFPLAGGETKVAALYYTVANAKGNAPFYANNSNTYGNTTYKRFLNGSTTASNVLAYDYEILELSGQSVFNVGSLPLTLFADWSQNMASGVQYDTAWAVGAALGKASNYRTWEASVMYESMDKDAMFAQFIDSDFAGGVTDSEGWQFKAGYAPVKNVVVNATYFLNTTNKDVYAVSGNVATGLYAGPYAEGKDMNYDRFQLDVNYKF